VIQLKMACGLQMRKILEATGQPAPESQAIMEINPAQPAAGEA